MSGRFSLAPAIAVQPAERPGGASLLALATGVVIVAALILAREILVPITLAVLLSFLLAPLVALLRAIRLGRVLSVLAAMLLAIGVVVFVAAAIGSQIADLAGNLPRYQATVENKVTSVQSFALARMQTVTARLEGAMRTQPAAKHAPAAHVASPPGHTLGRPAAAAAPPAPVPVIVQQPTSPFVVARRILVPVLGPLADAGLVFVVAIFILLQQDDLRDRLIRLFGSRDLHRTTLAMDDAGRRLSRYYLTQLAINTGFGVVTGGALIFIGVPSPILWGLLGTLLRFVPYFGPVIAAGLPTLLAAAVDPGWTMVFEVLALYVVTESVAGQLVEPLVYGHSTGLSPLAIIIAAIFWSWVWGLVGLMISTPLTLCLVVLGRHVERLEFLDVLLGDRPALTPVENLYQRLLAGDAEEAQTHAEQLLQRRSLSAYYDSVALPGLQLAVRDRQRGVLTDEQLARVRSAMLDIVQELDSVSDDEPRSDSEEDVAGLPQSELDLPRSAASLRFVTGQATRAPGWETAAPVLCIGGRNPLDEAAASMLAQLLGKHGVGARVLAAEAVSREAIADAPLAEAALIVVAYVGATGNPAYLRNLVRRLRGRTDVPVVVGLWPEDASVPADLRLREAVGADAYVTSLRDAVGLCVDAALGGRVPVAGGAGSQATAA